MKKLALSLVAATALAACGVAPAVTGSALGTTSLDAQSTAGLQAGWTSIHKALFNKIDILHQGFISEDEAGPYISLADFHKADVNFDGHLDFNEFMLYANRGGFLQSADTEDAFVARLRGQLAGIFHDLDRNRDGYLSQAELSDAALARENLAFYYPNLHITVAIKTVTPTEFKAADHLGNGLITQSEFEDLYVQMVVDALNPPAPAPAPAAN